MALCPEGSLSQPVTAQPVQDRWLPPEVAMDTATQGYAYTKTQSNYAPTYAPKCIHMYMCIYVCYETTLMGKNLQLYTQ